ncbi:hypothetical protein N3K66_002591 [Trichothecium roseum]|uniref:Uncharacterized protein n=1 Tax=Trichothecium roseum TaxID=47278 RepID=A0ACC0VAL7_9HYPO|nr:hypothetical protein N3K66_002591 [Trichothecium roseum]
MSKLFSAFKDKMASSKKPMPQMSSSSSRGGVNSNNPFASTGYTNDESEVPNIEEAPPAYTEEAAPPKNLTSDHGASRARSRSITPSTDNDPYAFLSAFDTIFIIDDSGSMAGSRWAEVGEVLAAIVPVCTKRDRDGIDVHFLNHTSGRHSPDAHRPPGGYYNLTCGVDVRDIFARVRPAGRTPTGERLGHVLSPYCRHLQRVPNPDAVRPVNVIVITDGRPTDYPDEVIRDVAARLDRLDAMAHQVGLQFFQVGRDADAAEHLRQLDDELVGVRDMVDTVTWDRGGDLSADAILKVVLGAVVRRLDRKSTNRQSPRHR